jgi:aromatic ring-cleaving dioxygenase
MIRTINNGTGVTVIGGTSSYPYFNMNSYSSTSIPTGTIRYNGQNYNFEVFDGHNWATLPNNHTMIELDKETKEILEWAKAKRSEENYLIHKYRDNPTIQDLLKERKNIDEKIQMIITILRDEVKV